MKWYYAVNGGRQGPVSDEELARLVASAVVTDDTLVWKQGMGTWQRYGEVKAGLPASPASAPTGADQAVCAMSGKVYPKSEMIEHEGRWVSAEHRDAYFQRLREGMALPGQLRYVGFGRRFGAKLIDFVVLTIVNQIVSIVIFMPMIAASMAAAQSGDAAQLGPVFALQALSILVNTSFNLLYTWFFLKRYQATPGKLALGIKIVRADGSPLSNGRIIGRYFAEVLSSLILFIGYLMAAFDKKEHKALHDQICDTRVVYK
ncbi:RDD family protein [Nibricoccus sp. IMCC34717]|uniref:RDD family protein n=1 Tax=Nibricoccus sp. IMCC34717 TaxID=3034021 RepID=UPI00384C81BD